jgi:hypothetical protein
MKTRPLKKGATEDMTGAKKHHLAGNPVKVNESRLSFGLPTGSACIQTVIEIASRIRKNPQNIQLKMTKSDRAANVLSLAIALATIKTRRKTKL